MKKAAQCEIIKLRVTMKYSAFRVSPGKALRQHLANCVCSELCRLCPVMVALGSLLKVPQYNLGIVPGCVASNPDSLPFLRFWELPIFL